MANALHNGRVIPVTTTGVKTNAQIIKIGSTVGVALASGASGELVEVAIEGVFTVVKDAGASTNVAQGGKVYTMTTGGTVKATGALVTGELRMGTAMAAAATGDTTLTVKLAGEALTVDD